MGQRLVKCHLYFHLRDYILLWGTPAGWDSSACEGHHKSEIKAPSKSTQRNKSTLIEQTANRQLEYRLLDRALAEYSLKSPLRQRTKHVISGSTFSISVRNHKSYMKWNKKANQNKPVYPSAVLDFVCEKVLPILSNKENVKGFTEHRRKNDNGEYIFRACTG